MKYHTDALWTRFTAHRVPAFTLVEVLVVIGLILVLLSLALPGLAGLKKQARALTALNSIRAMGQGLHLYTVDSQDFVPTFIPKTPVYARFGERPAEIVYRGIRFRDAWFTHSTRYHLGFSPLLPKQVCQAPGAPAGGVVVRIDGVTSSYSTDYALSETFYAEPAYWAFGTQRGPEQWAAQRVSSVAFPDRKGMLMQSRAYGVNNSRYPIPLAGVHDLPAAVLWCDQSASEEIVANLRPAGPANHFHYGVMSPYPADARGLPISNTEHGILGMDR